VLPLNGNDLHEIAGGSMLEVIVIQMILNEL